MNRIDLPAEDFDRYVKLAEKQGITPAEYLKRALEAYATYHHPAVPGKLPASVAAVPCPLCKARKGEPCKSVDARTKKVRYTQETHVYRRNDYRKIKDETRTKERAKANALLEEKRRLKREKHLAKIAAVHARLAAPISGAARGIKEPEHAEG